ncbi:hypothetical protein [Lentibacillus cibarius]|uniref:Uncharacterized protein n=1 Tax=Lentibacillus cibarius TaxID=2583219 RepID=A0A5S3QKX3_9BACI|nr:hypothetical protein [Lentibacillus cibarius]TMN21861.1 hypothetical protein FFL34_06835 [Lentibacillus cibarius]
MGISNFLRNLKKSIRERNALVREYMTVKKQYDHMMRDLEGKIKNAETDEEKERLKEFKQQIIDEGKRVRAEEEKKIRNQQK